jgi:hypothetical protein
MRGRDESRKECDFSAGVRGKYASRYARGSNVVVLAPDVAAAFPTGMAVNRALRLLLSKGAVSGSRRRVRRTSRA